LSFRERYGKIKKVIEGKGVLLRLFGFLVHRKGKKGVTCRGLSKISQAKRISMGFSGVWMLVSFLLLPYFNALQGDEENRKNYI
jgi:hypothetical protein